MPHFSQMCAYALPLSSYDNDGVRYDVPFDEEKRQFIGCVEEIDTNLAIHFANCLQYTMIHTQIEIVQWLENVKYVLLDGELRKAETADLVSRGILPNFQTIPVSPVFVASYHMLFDAINGIIYSAYLCQVCV